jgi:hypothetical protein
MHGTYDAPKGKAGKKAPRDVAIDVSYARGAGKPPMDLMAQAISQAAKQGLPKKRKAKGG